MRFDIDKVAGAAPRLATLSELRVMRPGPGGGVLSSPPISAEAFDRAILSWNGQGAWRFDLRVQVGEEWSRWRTMGYIDGEKQRSAAPDDADTLASVDIDILRVKDGKKARAFQVQAEGTGDLGGLSVAHFRAGESRRLDTPARAWGTTLPVPERSQGAPDVDPTLRGLVCSPTAVGMVLAYHGRSLPTADLARAVFDHEAKIYGNWPINTAVAARLLGGWASVAKLHSLADLEQEIEARRPVVLSHRWRAGELSNAPVRVSTGHLIVVAGFTGQGDVVVNDPAAKPGQVRRVYRRDEIFRTWQENAGGIAYLIWPSRR